MSERLDRWVSASIRDEIERRFYAKINEQASLSRLANDPAFMAAPAQHVGLFADHGVVHARDVAHQVLDVLATTHGILVPRRSPQRFTFMQGYGVLLAYFHDIGMIDFSAFGRTMHPEFAAQAVFEPALDDVIDLIWLENSGGLAWTLLTLVDRGVIRQDPKLLLRELLSLSSCHSKSKVPVALLNDPAALRSRLIEIVTTDRQVLFSEQQGDNGRPVPEPHAVDIGPARQNAGLARFAHLFPDDAYCWLTDEHPDLSALVDDVIDTVRALRAADALRQRGTQLETSGHNQVFVDQRSGNAIYALRLGKERLYMLELADPISAGEANIASSELDPMGDLRVSFHRGFFRNPGAIERAGRCAAQVILDIQADVIDGFMRTSTPVDLKQATEMAILLEETEDNTSFVKVVKDELARLNPACAARVRLTPSLTHVHPAERTRYLAAAPFTWEEHARRELLAQLSRTGHPAERIDQENAFNHVRLLTLDPGEVLIEAGTPSSFVYLPLGPGLNIVPLSGFQPIPAQPWWLLGATGVVRGAERNATIVAMRAVEVLMIPKSAYLAHWHHTLSLEEFQAEIRHVHTTTARRPNALSPSEKAAFLRMVPLFQTLTDEAIGMLAAHAVEVRVASGETVVVKDAVGDSVFVVTAGALSIQVDQRRQLQVGTGRCDWRIGGNGAGTAQGHCHCNGRERSADGKPCRCDASHP